MDARIWCALVRSQLHTVAELRVAPLPSAAQLPAVGADVSLDTTLSQRVIAAAFWRYLGSRRRVLQMKRTHAPLAPQPGSVGVRVALSLSISAVGVEVQPRVGTSLALLSRWQALAARVAEHQSRELRLLKHAQAVQARAVRQAFRSRVDPIPVEQVVLPNGLRDIGELGSCDYVIQLADCTSARGDEVEVLLRHRARV